MKKKELINKIDSLVDSLNSIDKELKACLKENAELKTLVEELSQKPQEKNEPILAKASDMPTVSVEEKAPEQVLVKEEKLEIEPIKEKVAFKSKEEPTETIIFEETKPNETPDKKSLTFLPVGEKVVLPDSIMEFGAEIIGKIVIESAKYADLVTASASQDKKELLNLIMGKSEVCKAEILNIVTGSASTDVKISLINAQLSEAVDYFKSVVAQI